MCFVRTRHESEVLSEGWSVSVDLQIYSLLTGVQYDIFFVTGVFVIQTESGRRRIRICPERHSIYQNRHCLL